MRIKNLLAIVCKTHNSKQILLIGKSYILFLALINVSIQKPISEFPLRIIFFY